MERRARKHPFVSQFGARVRQLRYERCLTVKELARRVGLWESHLEGIELGRIEPKLPTVRLLAQALKVQPFDLLNCDHTAEGAALVEEMRSFSPKSVRAVLVYVRDRVGRVALEQLKAEEQRAEKGSKGARGKGPALRKVEPMREGPRTSAPPAA